MLYVGIAVGGSGLHFAPVFGLHGCGHAHNSAVARSETADTTADHQSTAHEGCCQHVENRSPDKNSEQAFSSVQVDDHKCPVCHFLTQPFDGKTNDGEVSHQLLAAELRTLSAGRDSLCLMLPNSIRGPPIC